jgi:hypothetical protein
LTTPLIRLLSTYEAELDAEQLKLYRDAKANKPYSVIASRIAAQQQLVAELIPRVRLVRLSTPQEKRAHGALIVYLTALSRGLSELEAGYLAQPKRSQLAIRVAAGHFQAAAADLQSAERAYQTAKSALRS